MDSSSLAVCLKKLKIRPISLSDLNEDELTSVFNWLTVQDVIRIERTSNHVRVCVQRSLKERKIIRRSDFPAIKISSFSLPWRLFDVSHRFGRVEKFDFTLISGLQGNDWCNDELILHTFAKRYPYIQDPGRLDCRKLALFVKYLKFTKTRPALKMPYLHFNFFDWNTVSKLANELETLCGSVSFVFSVLADFSYGGINGNVREQLIELLSTKNVMKLKMDGDERPTRKLIDMAIDREQVMPKLLSVSVLYAENFGKIATIAPNIEQLYVADINGECLLDMCHFKSLKSIGLQFTEFANAVNIIPNMVSFIKAFDLIGKNIVDLAIEIKVYGPPQTRLVSEMISKCSNLEALRLDLSMKWLDVNVFLNLDKLTILELSFLDENDVREILYRTNLKSVYLSNRRIDQSVSRRIIDVYNRSKNRNVTCIFGKCGIFGRFAESIDHDQLFGYNDYEDFVGGSD